MKSNQMKQSARRAFSLLRAAEHELQRPTESAVIFCACQCTKAAVAEFLNSFLLAKTELEIKDNTLSGLLKQCRIADPHFSMVDITCFDCRNGNDTNPNYCLSEDKVNDCFKSMQVVRELVMAKLRLTEKDLES